MPAARDDYLLRLIQQAAAALRRLRAQLSGGDPAHEVASESHAVIGELLGTRRELYDRLDPHSAAQLLGDPERVRLWADLLALRADAMALAGNANESTRLSARSTALRSAVSNQPASPYSRIALD